VQVQGKTYSIIGAARSGIAVAKLLKQHGAEVFVSDLSPVEKMQSVRAELTQLNIAHEFGEHSERVLKCDAVVTSPGVPNDAPILRRAANQGLKVIAELEVASWFCQGPIVAITGTNGKTTTTALTGRMFDDARRQNVVGGNIGVAFSEVVEQTHEHTTAILEVSSFQLDTIETFHPRVSAILNITPDHLDRYEHSMENYIASKFRIAQNQTSGDVIVYNDDDELVRKNVEARVRKEVRRLPFSTTHALREGAFIVDGMLKTRNAGIESDVIATDAISIKGVHNVMNAMAATLMASAMNISIASLRATLNNFKGVEHRLEFVRELDGVVYVNDSKATNVDSVWYALQSFTQPIVLLLGGRDKGNDYSRLYQLVDAHVRAIVAIGESAAKVAAAFAARKPVSTATTMEEAVHRARRVATRGDVVLLSPACASFDWFSNYEHRGREFKRIVMSLS
jgi:UDP-N-acetylmuramoylalanine--D-glutamate ligase